MNARRSRQFLIVAFAISLLVHLIAATGFRWPDLMRPQDQIEVVRVEHLMRATVHRIRTPAPVVPTPRASAQPSAQPRKNSGKPPGSGSAGQVGERGSAPATAPPTVAPSASPTPLPCTKGDVAPALAASPAPPEIPAAARGAGTNGTARVRVTLDAGGAVQRAIVVDSSGNASLDLVAIAMARGAKYSPALHECKPVAADYTFAVRFAAW